MRILPYLAAMLLVTGEGETRLAPERWQLRIIGPATEEQGELRIEGGSGRILLESDDSAFQVLRDFHVGAESIAFTIPHDHRQFDGTITNGAMQGAVHNPDGSDSRWDASRMPATAAYWPVRPRVTVRQLELGSNDTLVRIPGAWVAALVDTATLASEYRQLALAAGLMPARGDGLEQHPRRLALGFDDADRMVLRRLMDSIFARFSQDANAATLFHRQDRNHALLDAYDLTALRTDLAPSRSHLVTVISGLTAPADSGALREAAWRIMERTLDTSWTRAIIDTLAGHGLTVSETGAVRAMFSLDHLAVEWWPNSVRWLMTHPWVRTPHGPRSPAQLVAEFWGVDSLPLPAIVPEMFGDFAAFPVFGAVRWGERFVVPKNASAREWLAQGGRSAAIDAWRDVAFGWPEPLPMMLGGREMTVTSPSGLNNTHAGAYLAGSDAIKIDPGIVPLVGVVTVIHEWQHLILSAKRVEGTAPGLLNSRFDLRIREDDPWLAEGAAEWITEQILRQARTSAPLLAFADAEKRLSIGATTPDDPHAFGYRLVRAVAKGKPDATVRDWLIRYLGDPVGLARVAGLAGRGKVPAMVLHRPATASLIPEVTFIWDDGFADQITHRLIIPTRPLEH